MLKKIKNWLRDASLRRKLKKKIKEARKNDPYLYD